MVGRANGDAVVAGVVAAFGAKDDVVVVQIAARTAGGDGAAPTVALEDRVAVARLRRPFEDGLRDHSLEGPPLGLGVARE